jgi:predicted MFS family arabinose efflux permease
MSFWAVSLPPAVAGLTNPRNRTMAFSLITSMGIGVGGVAGLLGGRLPGFLTHFISGVTSVHAKQIALLVGSGLAALAIFPGLFLAFPRSQAPERARRTYPRSRFVYTFLLALFVWSLGTGGFNPFFNAYFARHLHMPTQVIGSVFSYGQLTQVFLILLAPIVLKKVGQVKGIACMQVATAATLCLLAIVASPALAATAYIAYVCFQYMSEPCVLSMLMSQVATEEQSGASALHFMVVALAGIVSAMAAGAMFSRVGYTATLSACAAVTFLAAGLFYWLLQPGAQR